MQPQDTKEAKEQQPKLKIQIYGDSDVTARTHSIVCNGKTFQNADEICKAAVINYRKNRENGDTTDNPNDFFPNDGRYSWVTPGLSISKVHYAEGPKDRIWMVEKDRNYLARLFLTQFAAQLTSQEQQDLANNSELAAKAAKEIAKLPKEQLSVALRNQRPKLKAQTYGIGSYLGPGNVNGGMATGIPLVDGTEARRKVQEAAVKDYRANRENGDDKDSPKEDFIAGENYSWVTPNESYSKVLYTEVERAHEWMTEKDRNYLARLHLTGTKTPQEQQDLANNSDYAAKAAEDVARLPIEQLSIALRNQRLQAQTTNSSDSKDVKEEKQPEMKTQTYGVSRQVLPKSKNFNPVEFFPGTNFSTKKEMIKRGYKENSWQVSEPINDYRANRENGNNDDNPKKEFPCDGTYTWENSSASESKIQYTEGLQDRAWMVEKDRNYLARLFLVGANTQQEKQDLANNRELAARAAKQKLQEQIQNAQEKLVETNKQMANLIISVEEKKQHINVLEAEKAQLKRDLEDKDNKVEKLSQMLKTSNQQGEDETLTDLDLDKSRLEIMTACSKEKKELICEQIKKDDCEKVYNKLNKWFSISTISGKPGRDDVLGRYEWLRKIDIVNEVFFKTTILKYKCDSLLDTNNKTKLSRILDIASRFVMDTDAYDMVEGVKRGDFNAEDAIRKELIKPLKAQDIYGKAVLHYAAESGYNDVINFILLQLLKNNDEIIFELVKQTDSDGNTPLHLAAQNNKAKAVEILLEAMKVNVNYELWINTGNAKNETALVLAINNNCSAIVSLLKPSWYKPIVKLGMSLLNEHKNKIFTTMGTIACTGIAYFGRRLLPVGILRLLGLVAIPGAIAFSVEENAINQWQQSSTITNQDQHSDNIEFGTESKLFRQNLQMQQPKEREYQILTIEEDDDDNKYYESKGEEEKSETTVQATKIMVDAKPEVVSTTGAASLRDSSWFSWLAPSILISAANTIFDNAKARFWSTQPQVAEMKNIGVPTTLKIVATSASEAGNNTTTEAGYNLPHYNFDFDAQLLFCGVVFNSLRKSFTYTFPWNRHRVLTVSEIESLQNMLTSVAGIWRQLKMVATTPAIESGFLVDKFNYINCQLNLHNKNSIVAQISKLLAKEPQKMIVTGAKVSDWQNRFEKIQEYLQQINDLNLQFANMEKEEQQFLDTHPREGYVTINHYDCVNNKLRITFTKEDDSLGFTSAVQSDRCVQPLVSYVEKGASFWQQRPRMLPQNDVPCLSPTGSIENSV